MNRSRECLENMSFLGVSKLNKVDIKIGLVGVVCCFYRVNCRCIR